MARSRSTVTVRYSGRPLRVHTVSNASRAASLRRALCFFAEHGVAIERATSETGRALSQRRMQARAGASGCATPALDPATNGKPERFVQIHLHESACVRLYCTAQERQRQVGLFVERLPLQTTTRLARP
jgi:hypothetical protein